MNKSLFKLSTAIPAEKTDLVEGFLFEHAPSSWALEVNYLTGEGLLNGFFTSADIMQNQKNILSKEIGHCVKLNFSTLIIEEQDWKESYKTHFIPWTYNGFHLIPLWLKHTYKVPDDEISLFLDPGMAFGTGNHETTRMCLEFLLENGRTQQCSESLLDFGCGSGILSLVASLLGFENVIGLDNDPDAVRISKENATLNHLSKNTEFICSDLLDLEQPIGKFDCIVANIQADILISCASKIIDHCHRRSKIILSGILSKEIDQVISEFKKSEKDLVLNHKIKQDGEWSSVQFWSGLQ